MTHCSVQLEYGQHQILYKCEIGKSKLTKEDFNKLQIEYVETDLPIENREKVDKII